MPALESPASPVSSAPPSAGLWSPANRELTIGLVLTITLVAFESLAVATVMPIVKDDLHGIELYGWVFSAFFLGSLVGIVVVGGLIDRGSLVPPYLAGLGLFGVGLLLCGFAPSMPVLVAGRVLQGLGAGATPPIAYVAIGRSLDESLRARMFATLSTAWVLPGLIGPAIASFIGAHLGWRAVFLLLVPLIAIAAAITLPALAKVPGPDETEEAAEHRASEASARRLPFALAMAVGAALFLAGLTASEPAPFAVLVVVGAALGTASFARLTPRGTLRATAGIPAAVLLRGILTFAFFAVDAYVPLALVAWRGADVVTGGLALTAATLAWTAGAWIQARRIEAWGARRFVAVGYATVLAAIAGFLAALHPSVPVVLGIAAWALAGFGMGLAYAALSLTVLREAAAGTEGSATAALQLADVLGTALGAGAAGAIVAAGDRLGAAPGPVLGVAFAFAIAAALGGLLLTPRLTWHVRRPARRVRAAE